MHRRTVTAATSLVLPIGFALLIGITGTLIDLVAIAWIARPWAMHAEASAIALLVLLGVGAPIGYFVLGWSYGMGRAVFRVYLTYREPVAELVIAQLTDGRPRETDDWSRDVPLAMRRVLKIVLMLIGAGDRLQDAVGDGKPKIEIVAAIVDDLLRAIGSGPASSSRRATPSSPSPSRTSSGSSCCGTSFVSRERHAAR